MDLQNIFENFNLLSSHEKIKFIYNKLNSISQEYKTHFLLAIITDENSSPIVRATALKFLPKSGYQKPDICQQFLNDSDPVVVQAAKRALKEFSIQDKKDKYKVKIGLRKKEYSYKKHKKLKTLKEVAKINASWVPKVLLEDLEDSSEEIRDFIINELANSKNVNLNTIHQKLLTAPWYVKSALLKILAHKKSYSSVMYIEGVIEHPNAEVRQNAAVTLGEIGGNKASELLIKLIKDKNPYVKKSALEALERASSLKFI